MSDIEAPKRRPLSEIELRRAFQSFETLMETAITHPGQIAIEIGKFAASKEAYPVDHAVLFLIGIIFGCTVSSEHVRQEFNKEGFDINEVLSQFRAAHYPLMQFNPLDYFGPSRTFARTGKFPET